MGQSEKRAKVVRFMIDVKENKCNPMDPTLIHEVGDVFEHDFTELRKVIDIKTNDYFGYTYVFIRPLNTSEVLEYIFR